MTSHIKRRVLIAGLFAAIGTEGFSAPDESADRGQETLARLRAGNCVIYFRHAATGPPRNDRPYTPRDEQRNLSDKGIAQSRDIGKRIRALRIPLGRVLASPFYRCFETADLAFGRHEIEPMLISLANSGRPYGRVSWLRQTLSEPVAGGGNLVIVGHVHNLLRVARVNLREAEAAIILPDASGKRFSVAGLIPSGSW
jgi:phosphohistidine phosphatase SixA